MPAVNLGSIGERPPSGLYWDEKALDGEGANIITHSMLKTFRRCPKQAEFKYVHRLKPKRLGSPLKRGTWVHSLLEVDGEGGDWKEQHAKFSKEFDSMFDDEKEFYGDMPNEINQIFQSYKWHYKDDPWEYVANEITLEARLPDGSLYRGKVDAIIRDQYGKLWLVDHKTHKTLPKLGYRLLDAQSALYIWAARENGYEVEGFIWNYIRWKAPSTPKVVDLKKPVARLSDSACDTDFPTMYKAIKKYQKEIPNFRLRPQDKATLKRLQAQRFELGKPQTSEFFRRDILEKSDDMIERVLQGNFTTALRMNEYDFDHPDQVERVVDRGCEYSCSYLDICSAELMGANMAPLIKNNYTVGDPNAYYQDRAGDFEKEER